jgi:hypothetical protein
MRQKSRVEQLAEQFGVDPKAVTETLRQLPVPHPPPAANGEVDDKVNIDEASKPAPDWDAYRETVQAAGLDVGSPLTSPRTLPPNACKACGSAKTDGKCTSGCDGLIARVVPQAVGWGRRSR